MRRRQVEYYVASGHDIYSLMAEVNENLPECQLYGGLIFQETAGSNNVWFQPMVKYAEVPDEI